MNWFSRVLHGLIQKYPKSELLKLRTHREYCESQVEAILAFKEDAHVRVVFAFPENAGFGSATDAKAMVRILLALGHNAVYATSPGDPAVCAALHLTNTTSTVIIARRRAFETGWQTARPSVGLICLENVSTATQEQLASRLRGPRVAVWANGRYVHRLL